MYICTCGVVDFVLMNTVSFQNRRNNDHVVLLSKLKKKKKKSIYCTYLNAISNTITFKIDFIGIWNITSPACWFLLLRTKRFPMDPLISSQCPRATPQSIPEFVISGVGIEWSYLLAKFYGRAIFCWLSKLCPRMLFTSAESKWHGYKAVNQHFTTTT